MTLRATFTAAFPEARRISNFLERDFSDAGVVVSLDELSDNVWSVDAYFESGEADSLAARLRDRLGSDGFCAPLKVEALPEADWVAAGLTALAPVTVGRFVVHGRHDRGSVPRGRIAIEIDAGQAFGTGHHATTAGCLMAIDALTRSRRCRNALDFGAGSGVLAIAIARLLRRPVLAADVDPVATRIAAANAMLNHIGPLVRAVTTRHLSHPAIRSAAPFDLVVANILAEPLQRLAPRLAPLLAKGGTLVLSGLLPQQRERVVGAYGAQGVRLRAAYVRDGWAVLILSRSWLRPKARRQPAASVRRRTERDQAGPNRRRRA
jgi:ribosomal protein L11 methyltransferase